MQTDSPRIIHHLGHSHYPRVPDFPDFRPVSSGPNEGYTYLGSFPERLDAIVHISRAFNSGHPWRLMQTGGPVVDAAGQAVLDKNGTPIQYCRQHQIPIIRDSTEAHERRHVAEMDRFFRTYSPIGDLEAFAVHPADLAAGPLIGHLEVAWNRRINEGINANHQWYLDTADSGLGGTVPPIIMPCALRFY